MQSDAEKFLEFVKTPDFLAEAREVFFTAMNERYGNVLTKPRSNEFFGEAAEYDMGEWVVRCTNEIAGSSWRNSETILLRYEGISIWTMQHIGQCAEEALPCLEAALHAAYAEKKFFGGRGPDEFVHDGLVYRNEVDRSYRADFQTSNFFKGYETIRRREKGAGGTPGEVIGWHSYQGMMMF